MKKLTLLLGALVCAVALGAQSGESVHELVVSFPQMDVTFDPHHAYTATEAQLFTAMYEGLVSYNPLTLEPMPAAAKNWEVSADKKLFTFHIRDNARYWDGSPVLAEHFKQSWLHLLDPNTQAEFSFLLDSIKGAKAYRTGIEKDPEKVGIRVLAGNVLQVELNEPGAHFLKVLSHHSLVCIHPSLLGKPHQGKETAIISNGPFYLYKKTDRELVFVKNKLYWGETDILLDRVKILFKDAPEELTQLFNAGEIQWITNTADYEKLLEPGSIITNAMFATNYFFFVTDKAPFNLAEVRRGLALLLPWDQIRKERFLHPATTTLIPPIPDYPENSGIKSQEIQQGLSLLEKAGYAQGQGLPPLVIRIPQGEEATRIARLMKESWEKLLKVVVNVEVSGQAYFENLKKGGYTLGTMTWIGDYADPLSFLQLWLSDSNLNDARYHNPEFDDLIHKSMGQDHKERYRTLAQAEELLLNQAVVLPLFNLPAINVVDLQTIEGWFPNVLDIHPFKYIRFRKDQLLPGVALLK